MSCFTRALTTVLATDKKFSAAQGHITLGQLITHLVGFMKTLLMSNFPCPCPYIFPALLSLC